MYFLVNGIYLCWSIFVKTYVNPVLQSKIQFSKQQEHVRKDIKRCFGVLVKKFGILKRPLRGWYTTEIKELIDCCVILHNMTQEVRMHQYSFTEKYKWEEVSAEDKEVQKTFCNEEDEVEGGEGGIAEALHARVAHMSSVLEESTKHVGLRVNLMQHIMQNR